jgi:hypothetical protein
LLTSNPGFAREADEPHSESPPISKRASAPFVSVPAAALDVAKNFGIHCKFSDTQTDNGDLNIVCGVVANA